MNGKRVRRIMREDNLLCLRRRKFVAATDSKHTRAVYPNQAKGMDLSGIHQLRIADITYIGLRTEFVSLAVVLDAFSRRRRCAWCWSEDRRRPAGCIIPRSPWDNAARKSLMKTLKYEEIYRQEYRGLEEARALIEEFLEEIYNQKRLHSALGYRPPVEFQCGSRSAEPDSARAS